MYFYASLGTFVLKKNKKWKNINLPVPGLLDPM
jgi:hypothetical protein